MRICHHLFPGGPRLWLCSQFIQVLTQNCFVYKIYGSYHERPLVCLLSQIEKNDNLNCKEHVITSGAMCLSQTFTEPATVNIVLVLQTFVTSHVVCAKWHTFT